MLDPALPAVAAIAVQPDGRIVTAGAENGTGIPFSVTRYTSGGSLDPTFGTGGRVEGAIDSTGVAVQADGKIVIVGSVAGALRRQLCRPAI